MAKLLKLIWRLDYKVSFAYFDARGRALRALDKTVKDFWDSVGDGAVSMSFAAKHTDKETYRVFSLEATSMNGALEWASGTDLGRVLSNEQFRSVDRILKELGKICELRVLTRAGIRTYVVERHSDGRRDKYERFLGLLERARMRAETALGPITDGAITFEGTTKDKLIYRAQFGPYEKKNLVVLDKKLSEEETAALDEFDLFFDIDLSENNISFEEHSFGRWADTKIAKAMHFIELCSGANHIEAD